MIKLIKTSAANCWLYAKDGGPVALIDPGSNADSIRSQLEELQVTPSIVLITHGHFDHVGALPDLAAHYPGLEVAIHSADADYLGPAALETHRKCWRIAAGDPGYVDHYYKPMPVPSILLEEGTLVSGLRVLHVPGHSPGSVAFYDEEAGVLFSGDCLFRGGVGRTDLPGGNYHQLLLSLRRLLELPPNTVVYPGHDATTTIRAER